MGQWWREGWEASSRPHPTWYTCREEEGGGGEGREEEGGEGEREQEGQREILVSLWQVVWSDVYIVKSHQYNSLPALQPTPHVVMCVCQWMVCGVCPAHSDAAVDCREAALGLARHVLQVDQRHHTLRGILQTILCHSSQGGREGGKEGGREGGREGMRAQIMLLQEIHVP